MVSPDIATIKDMAAQKGWPYTGAIVNDGFRAKYRYSIELIVPSKSDPERSYKIEISLLSKTDTLEANDWKLFYVELKSGVMADYYHFLYKETEAYLKSRTSAGVSCHTSMWHFRPFENSNQLNLENLPERIPVMIEAADDLHWLVDTLRDALKILNT